MTSNDITYMGGIIYLMDGTQIIRKPGQNFLSALGKHDSSEVKSYQYTEQMSRAKYEQLKKDGVLP